MTPKIQKPGTSFKGAALYYLHDKKQSGETERLTDERVEWVEMRNLPTERPDVAWKLMAATAMAHNEIRKANGEQARKDVLPVLTWSIAWHPEQQPSREEMLKAADETIKLLGFEDRQAMIVCHNDTAHPHVHVVLNRVSPETGRTDNLSWTKRKFSEWALKFERDGGKIYCQKRVENRDRRLKGDFIRASRDIPRDIYEKMMAARRLEADQLPSPAFNKAAEPPQPLREKFEKQAELSAERVRSEQKREDAGLQEAGRALYEKQQTEMRLLANEYRQSKAAVTTEMRRAVDEAKRKAAERRKDAWRELYRDHWRNRRAYERKDRTFLGRMVHSMRVARDAPELKGPALGRRTGVFLIAALSAKRRREGIERSQAADRLKLSGSQRQEEKSVTERVRASFKSRYQDTYRVYQNKRAVLEEIHATQKAELQVRWRARRTEKAAAWDRYNETVSAQRDEELKRKLEQAEAAYEKAFRACGPDGPVKRDDIEIAWRLAREVERLQARLLRSKPPAPSQSRTAEPGHRRMEQSAAQAGGGKASDGGITIPSPAHIKDAFRDNARSIDDLDKLDKAGKKLTNAMKKAGKDREKPKGKPRVRQRGERTRRKPRGTDL